MRLGFKSTPWTRERPHTAPFKDAISRALLGNESYSSLRKRSNLSRETRWGPRKFLESWTIRGNSLRETNICVLPALPRLPLIFCKYNYAFFRFCFYFVFTQSLKMFPALKTNRLILLFLLLGKVGGFFFFVIKYTSPVFLSISEFVRFIKVQGASCIFRRKARDKKAELRKRNSVRLSFLNAV